jgi:HNH endonuclease
MCSVSASAARGLNCERCGKSFAVRGFGQRFCSTRCTSNNYYHTRLKPKRPHAPPRSCETCGVSLPAGRECPQRWCSPKCRQRACTSSCATCGGPSWGKVCRQCYVPHNLGKSKHGTITRDGKNACPKCGEAKCAASAVCVACWRQEQKPNTFICRGCGKESGRPSRRGRDPRIYCSRECYFATKTASSKVKASAAEAAKAERKAERNAEKAAKLASRTCRKCGVSVGELPKSTTTCLECQKHRTVEKIEKKCKRCRRAYKTSERNPAAMCQQCTKQLMKRRAKHSSRCRRRGLPYDPKVTVASLYMRHQGKCFWCGVACLERYSHGKQRHRSPTVDHVVPILHERNASHGHTFSNCVLCCSRCNTHKGDTLDEGALLSECPVAYMEESCGPTLRWTRKELFMDSWITQPKTPLFGHFARQKHMASRAANQQNNAFFPRNAHTHPTAGGYCQSGRP